MTQFKIRDDFLPFCRHSIGEAEENAVLQVMRSQWITSGPVTKSFESEFGEFVDAPHAIAVNSCTAGLYMVFQTLDIKEGDEVIVPAITWPATANSAALLGAKVIFADVDYTTHCLTRESIEPHMTEKTKAIALVHFAGLACEMDPIIELCKEKGIALIEDAAHALGTAYRGKHIGGDYAYATIYSFHPIKNITSGEGGMITTHHPDVAEKLALYRFHGISRDAWRAYKGGDIPLYDLEFPALKFNQTDLLSAIGRVQLQKVGQFNHRRRQIAEQLISLLSDIDGIELPQGGPGHAWHLFVIKILSGTGVSRDHFIARLKSLNLGAGIHFLAVNELDYYRKLNPASTPNAKKIGATCVSLPFFPAMHDEDVEYVASAVSQITD